MEDHARDVASVKSGKRKAKRRTKAKERLTIMIFKTVGRVWTVKVSALLLVGAFLFFASYVVATILMSYHYFDLLRAAKKDVDERSHLTKELASVQRSLEQSHHQIALLKEHVEQQRAQIYTPQPVTAVSHTESWVSDVVDVTDIEVDREGPTLTVTFRIANKRPDAEPMGGYIFVLTRVKGADHSDVWVYPNCPLKEGLPAHYKRGHRFSIQRFIGINTTYTLNKSVDDPLILQIVVYDKTGTLILIKQVEV